MRPSFLLLTASFCFVTLHACSDDTPLATHPGETPAPGDTDGGTEPPNGDGQAPDDPGAPSSKVDTTTETVEVDGNARQYILSVPKSYDAARSYPLIVALHGDGLNASGFVSFSKLEASTGEDAILAYPEGSIDLFTPYDQNADQKLIELTINAVKAKYSIDASKIWGFGYSKGAYQLNEIACKKPGIVTAMAIHAGGAPQTRDGNGAVDCPAAVGLPVFVTHGEKDTPAECNGTPACGGEFAASYWASRAGCQTTRSATQPDICEAYDGCDPGKPVVFCIVPDQPHYPLYGEAAAHSWAWFNSL